MDVAVSLAELLGPRGRRDPYPFYAGLHERGQACALGPDDRHAAVVHGHAAAHRVLRDPMFRVLDAEYLDRSSTRWRDHPVVRTLQDSLFNANGADHARLRRLFGQAVGPRRMDALEPAIVRVTERLLDRLAELGAGGEPVDFMASFALPAPSDVIAEMIGVPESDRAWFPERVRTFDAVLEIGQRSFRQVKAADAAAVELTAYFADLVASRREHPRDDFISAVAAIAAAEPDRLSETELLANLIVLFNAGFRTTANMLGNGLAALAAHPDAMAALRADPSLVPSCLEEILRYDPPVHFAIRFAAEDTEVAGVPIRAGQSVVVLIGAANRDPRRFPDPDTFDPARADNNHLSFSAGPHYCLGAALARLEGKIILPRLLERFPDLTLAAEPGPREHLMLRGYDRLPVFLHRATTRR
jgi:cytochrome P450